MSARKNSGARWARVLVVLQIACVALPLSIIAVWAFTDSWPWPNLLPESFSLRGMQTIVRGGDATGLGCLLLSVEISVVCAVLTTAVAILAARAICFHRWVGRTAFEYLTMLPFLIPTTVFAMGVQVAFIRLHLAYTAFGVVLAHAIVALPYAVAIMTETTCGAGQAREQAARTLGASGLRAFWHVSLPTITPGILSSLCMSFIISFSQYFLTLLIGGGKVRTFALILFPYLSGGDRTIAGAYALVFLATTLLVFVAFRVILRKTGGSTEETALYGEA
ncbi:ABC transporter permease [Adlercreutzia sp. ZJ141]|uniref:ABC transporter permease n=1 Tax=Adlercreutzia sp. ZJ141 TaxID=2709406 RepID=UPI0013EAEC2B|nr:ABC transporter permease subunit [Adlercreutzia sp. ZJ141]